MRLRVIHRPVAVVANAAIHQPAAAVAANVRQTLVCRPDKLKPIGHICGVNGRLAKID
jgi:hypothetical protein